MLSLGGLGEDLRTVAVAVHDGGPVNAVHIDHSNLIPRLSLIGVRAGTVIVHEMDPQAESRKICFLLEVTARPFVNPMEWHVGVGGDNASLTDGGGVKAILAAVFAILPGTARASLASLRMPLLE